MKIAALFLWLVVPLGFWLAASTWGTPHIIGTYTYLGSGYLPPEARTYTSCRYYGWQGVITVPATYGQCPWVQFFKAGDQ